MASRWTLAGDAYVTGRPCRPISRSPTRCPPTTLCEGAADAFVSKLSFDARPARSRWSTPLTWAAAARLTTGNGIAVDSRQRLRDRDHHSPDFPLAHPLPTNTPYQGSQNAFVSKLSFDARAATLTLAYSTYLGGSGSDVGLWHRGGLWRATFT